MVRVLIVDDHDLVRRALCRMIRELGHRCHCVGTKAEALRLLEPGSHALVIADEMLPDGRGRAVVERAEQLGIKAITMSGHPEVRTVAGRTSVHLAKPFGMDEFEQALTDSIPAPRQRLG